MEPAGEKLLAVLVMAMVCIFGVISNVWAMVIIEQNDKISDVVRIYFLADHIERLIICNITIFFTTTCAYTFFCKKMDHFTVGWLSNRVMGYVKVSVIISTHLFTLALSFNRFFAVIYEGRYYDLIIKQVSFQSIFLTVVPFILMSPLLLQGEDSYYDPDTFGWWNEGDISNFIVANVWYNSCIVIWVVAICIDTTTAVKIRRKLRHSGHGNVKKLDVQIMKQVMSLHLVYLSYYLTMRILDYLKAWKNWDNLDCMWFYDFLPAAIDLFAGLSRVLYLSPKQHGKIVTSQSTSISRNAASINLPVNHEIPKVA